MVSAMTIRLPAAAFLLLVLLPVLNAAWASQSPHRDLTCETMSTFEFRPGVIVDSDRSALYLMNSQHGIDAVDLSSGMLLWRTSRAAKPLLVYDDHLIAQGESPENGALSIVVLDTSKGKIQFEAALELPAGVLAGIDDRLGTAFRVSAYPYEGDVIAAWHFSQQHISGAAPGPDAPKPIQQSGKVRVSLAARSLEKLDANENPLPTEPPLPENIARLVESGAIRAPLMRSGRTLAAVVRRGGKPGSGIALSRWYCDTGRPLAEVQLFQNDFTFRYASADGRHLLASKHISPSRPAKYLWSIYAVESGDPVTELSNASPGAWFFLNGSTLIHELPATHREVDGRSVDEPPRLRAIAVETGAETWRKSVRNTAYKGSYPPAIPGR